jgi:ABC-type Fe3+/spermidine/putrescine transport system ATPase subunit
VLEVEGLAKRWPGFSLEASLSLAKGEILCVLGPSGCGKSTLLRLVAGLEAPDGGRIVVAGRDLSSLPPERRGIGMVFQDLALFPHLSVERNIEYGLRLRGIGRRRRAASTARLAEALEIGALLGRGVASLSGGERQRVALARTLAVEPELVLLDEPFSSLDASLRRRVRSELVLALRKAGATAILVTHDAEEAFEIGDRVILMRSGSIEAEGRPEDLHAEPPTAWCASFLGLGPVLDAITVEVDARSTLASTPIGPFRVEGAAPERCRGAAPLALFFPASAPVGEARSGIIESGENCIEGRVMAQGFAGRFRRVSLALPVSPRYGGTMKEITIEIELPVSTRPLVGELLRLHVPPPACRLLPIGPSR